MALKAGTAYVDVGAKVSSTFHKDVEAGISTPMADTGKKAGGILGSSASKAAAVAAGGVLAKVGTDFLTSSVDAARESAKIAAQSEAVVKSTGGAANITADQMGDLAEAISKKTAVDDEAIQSAENLLATFTNVRNEAGKGNDIFNQATETLVDMGAALGTDAAGSAIQLGKALNDPVKGISALTRVGVTFTEEQKKMIEGMVEAGDVAGAQKVILAELQKEFGGSAAAQATNADRLALAWGNVQEEIGGKLIPVLETVSGFLAEHSELILPLAGVIGGVLVLAFGAWAISAAAAAAATIAAAAPVLGIIAVIGALATGIFLLVKNWEQVWSKIVGIASAAWDGIKRGVEAGIRFVVFYYTELPGKILSAIASLPGKMLEFGKKLMAKLVEGIGAGAGKVAGAIGGAVKSGASKIPIVGGLFKAAGGPVAGSRSYVVGERGPEVFVPRVSGGIVPTSTILEALGSSGGGGPLVGSIQVDARGADDAWKVGDTLNRTLREYAYAEGWG